MSDWTSSAGGPDRPWYRRARSGGTCVVGDVDGALTPEQDRAQGSTPADDLLQLDILQPGQVADTHHAYQRTKRGNALRVTGGDVLIDGGVTASYVYGALQP